MSTLDYRKNEDGKGIEVMSHGGDIIILPSLDTRIQVAGGAVIFTVRGEVAHRLAVPHGESLADYFRQVKHQWSTACVQQMIRESEVQPFEQELVT